MPYTEYPIYYTNATLGHTNRKLYAQTVSRTLISLLDNFDKSYSYCNSKELPLLNPNSYPVPIAPWFPYSTSTPAARWGLPAAVIRGLQAYSKPGLHISSSLSNNTSDIALAGTRPVNTNNQTITISPNEFSPYGSNSTEFSAIQIVVYVSREADDGASATQPRLVVRKQYFNKGSTSSTPDKVELVSSAEIPDVPYFFFNFAVSAPGAPGRNTGKKYWTTIPGGIVYYLCPGGGSGAGAQFTAILYTKPVPVLELPPIGPTHTDNIKIRYTLASQSYSSSIINFDPTLPSETKDNGIDLVSISANLHCFVPGPQQKYDRFYYYKRSCTLPGGLIFPGVDVYSDKAKKIINDFINNKDSSALVDSSFPMDKNATKASALIFHKANWMPPGPEESLFNFDATKYTLSQPFTVFNPESLFPGEPITKVINTLYTGASGRPSILFDGANPTYQATGYYYNATYGDKGSGGSGAIWRDNGSSPTSYSASGGPTTIILSW